MKKVLKLKFKDDSGKSATLSLDAPREDLTDENVKSAMDTVVGQSILATSNGNLTRKDSAQIVTTEVQEFDIQD